MTFEEKRKAINDLRNMAIPEDSPLYNSINLAIEAIANYDSTEKVGQWKRISMDKYSEHAKYWYRCDRCGEDNLGNTNYCPNCGAKMEKEDAEKHEFCENPHIEHITKDEKWRYFCRHCGKTTGYFSTHDEAEKEWEQIEGGTQHDD